jgi:hypothetical protein
METKELFVVRPTDNEQKEFIITVGKHLATKKKFKTKEEAETYIKYPKWDTTFALIAEMIESNENTKYATEEKPKEPTSKKSE